MIKGILLIFGLLFTLPIINSIEIVQALTLLNTTNYNSTMNNNNSVQTASKNTTIPNTLSSIPEDDQSGDIASLPDKCLGSALCPE